MKDRPGGGKTSPSRGEGPARNALQARPGRGFPSRAGLRVLLAGLRPVVTW